MHLCVCDGNVPLASLVQKDLGQIRPLTIINGFNINNYFSSYGRNTFIFLLIVILFPLIEAVKPKVI